MAAAVTRGPGRPKMAPPDEVIFKHIAEDGMSYQQIADTYGMSKSGVASIVRREREKRNAVSEKALPPFPWVISQEHTRGRIYETMHAYRRHAAGFPCNTAELRLAEELRTITARLGVAVTYDYEKGFTYTSRLPEDGEQMFVVRAAAAKAPTSRRR